MLGDVHGGESEEAFAGELVAAVSHKEEFPVDGRLNSDRGVHVPLRMHLTSRCYLIVQVEFPRHLVAGLLASLHLLEVVAVALARVDYWSPEQRYLELFLQMLLIGHCEP